MPLALITGGASLICEGVAQCLARDGWDLAITDLNVEGAKVVASRIASGGRVEAHALDARKIGDVDALVRDLTQRYGAIEGLVNGAGGARGIGFQRKPFVETSQERVGEPAQLQPQHRAQRHAHCSAGHDCGRSAAPSSASRQAAACAADRAPRSTRPRRQASSSFTQSIAQEVGKHGVRVNSIAPGNAEARWKKDDADARSPLGRNTNAQDVGDAVAFLLSERARTSRAHVSTCPGELPCTNEQSCRRTSDARRPCSRTE